MHVRILLLATLLLTGPALAGCFGSRSGALGDPRIVVADAGARASAAGWAYDGAGLAATDARLDGTFNDAENTGSAVIQFTLGGSAWRVEFDAFAEAAGRTFMDGGIEFDLVEHGDSGVADASVPRLLALVAAWGEARVTVDGTPVPDPNTGGPTWAAHVMASDTTVRDASGRITKADGATPYDPASPGDAKRVEGDRQLLFSLKAHPRAAAPTPFEDNQSVDVRGPSDVKTFPMPAEIGGQGKVTVTLAPIGGPLAAGDLTVTVVDPSGTEVGSTTLQITPAGAQGPAEIPFLATAAGEYTVTATGRGAFGYVLGMTVAYLPDAFMTVTWDDFTIS